ncbi:hypothetical protein POKO110462_21540 [Pontibacter korlensis]|uniref:Uncharacterized protein n=1 Tax=Pontibacter korlensis TaxID=400092 RepID=A0A0E3ZIY4_9BACT|nr:hypothetical protein [Pontibacter korlensis]AKD04923.1 hypothetical protein PKOR_19770 [Pontibacter korlensis]
MTQKEKLDLIMRRLFELRDDKYSHTLTSIMKELDIYETDSDMRRLATRLEDELLAKGTWVREGVYIKITTHGIDYYEQNLSRGMKQSEKLDRVLRWLYDRRDQEGLVGNLEPIMQELGIYQGREEAERIANELTRLDLATIFPVSDGAGIVRGITPKGISYCEGETFSQPSQPDASVQYVFNGNFHANNAVLGNGNSHIQQSSSTSTKEAEDLIKAVREELQKSTELSEEERESSLECVDDIEDSVKAKKTVRKYQWSTLLNNTSKAFDIYSKVEKLWQAVEAASQTPTP